MGWDHQQAALIHPRKYFCVLRRRCRPRPDHKATTTKAACGAVATQFLLETRYLKRNQNGAVVAGAGGSAFYESEDGG